MVIILTHFSLTRQQQHNQQQRHNQQQQYNQQQHQIIADALVTPNQPHKFVFINFGDHLPSLREIFPAEESNKFIIVSAYEVSPIKKIRDFLKGVYPAAAPAPLNPIEQDINYP